MRIQAEIVIEVNSIKLINKQLEGIHFTQENIEQFTTFWKRYSPETNLNARNQIISQVCPNICGMFHVKLALLLVILGGVSKTTDRGMSMRGESHLLLVGDPGIGKSQFLKWTNLVVPRSIITTGTGTTSAGLTVAVIKDSNKEFMLEAGALVLADGGICCIDEFSSMKERDRQTIHEAMEQQSISIAKAGIVTKLSTRTTVVATTQLKGNFHPTESLSKNLQIATPLLSRFDIILILPDKYNEELDRKKSSFILHGYETVDKEEAEEPYWSLELLQLYIAYVKLFQPVLTPEAKEVLAAYYRRQRQADLQDTQRITIRFLESLIRLAHAHAKLMFRETVLLDDAIVAILVMETTPYSSSLCPTYSMYPDTEPLTEFQRQRDTILKSLQIHE